jgi:hypothetical protein
MVKRLVGQKGWLISYRFERCCCDICGNECTCGNGFSRKYPPTWYATKARLLSATFPDNARQPFVYGIGDAPAPAIQFMQETPWQRITPDKWVYGDRRITNLIARSYKNVYTIDDLVTERHWPTCVGSTAPAHGYWWYKPLQWLEDAPWLYETCVGHWTSGGWQLGFMGTIVYNGTWSAQSGVAGLSSTMRVYKPPGVLSIYNPGDWPAICRLGFTNFTWLLLRFRWQGQLIMEMLVDRPVTSPQYLYVDTSNGEVSARYCPVSDDPCMDLSQLATFVPEASTATPASVTINGNLIGCIRPGLTQIEVAGFRMPGLRFHWAYDMTPIYS